MEKYFEKLISSTILKEKKWNKKLRKCKDANFNEGYYNKYNIYIKVILGIFSTIYIKKKNISGKVIIISHRKNELANDLLTYKNSNYFFFGTGLRALYFKYGSLLDLEAIYYLINYNNIFYRGFRKWALKILFQYVKRQYYFLTSNIFVIDQDYTGAQSIITSISENVDLRLIAIQHGLMRYSYFKTNNIYPCMRVKVELVFNEHYKQILINKKPLNSKVINFGPPINYSNNEYNNEPIKIYFISSCDLLNDSCIYYLKELNKKLKINNIELIVRPHPQEINRFILNDIKIDSSSIDKFLSKSNNNSIFFGFYSTLLYYSAFKGYKTIWLHDSLDGNARDDLDFTISLPNAMKCDIYSFHDKLIKEIIKKNIIEIKPNSVAKRFDKLINSEYPNFLCQ